ncbi:hypothetical protein [Xanthomonas sacchari]|uniref:hypothetical protein n=1 Tax=Xanthomonas sacchari TaxID=56458 RepID=UPI00224EC6D1|nr:hypothetical protein [Xanthomonas sacchari]MCW0451355.1 hypothetical protein [Xanthomonas sacchari]
MTWRLLCAPVLLALTACGAVDTVKNAYAHSREVAADLEKSVGSKPAVGFDWANGSLVQVTVNFQGVPHKPLAQIVRLGKALGSHALRAGAGEWGGGVYGAGEVARKATASIGGSGKSER